jgi:hypothetical protein
MEKNIWKLSLPYLKKGKKKNFVIHTEGVLKAMKLLLKREKGNKNLLLPAAILHDTGWSNVPIKLQLSKHEKDKIKALEQHIRMALPIVQNILSRCNFNKKQIEKIADIIIAHKFKNPRDLNKRLLIDADTLSDVFKEQFYSDAKAYKISPKEMLRFRKQNKFYTKTAKIIFEKELIKRENEIKNL